MPCYRFGSLLLTSAEALPELPRAATTGRAAGAHWRLRVRRTRVPIAHPVWFHRWDLPNGREWLLLARTGHDYLLRFPRMADVSLDVGRRTIDCHPSARATAATVRHLLLDQVLPMVAARGRTFALHASAVRGRRGIVAFLGPAGAGKSTLAVTLARRGWALVGDDCLFVEIARGEVRGRAAYAGARLHADSLRAIEGVSKASGAAVAQYTRKRRIDSTVAGLRIGAAGTRAKIEKLYVLTPDARLSPDRPRVVPLSSRAAMLELLRFTFHLDPFDRRAIASRFDLAALAAQRVPACRLSFRHDFSGLEALGGRVEADLIE